MINRFNKIIFIFFFIFYNIYIINGLAPNIRSFTLKPIISIGNYCPFINYGLEFSIDDKNYTLLVDTGNTMILLPSEECKYGCIPFKNLYTPSPNSVIEKDEVSGYYADDTAWFGQLVADRLQIHNQEVTYNTRFISIRTQSKPLSNPICQASTLLVDGTLGLGYSREETSFLLQYTRAANISEIFSISLCENNPRIWFGGYDTNLLTSPLSFTQISNKQYDFELKTVFIGNSSIYQVTDFVWRSIIDTSTPFIHLPSSLFEQTIQYLVKTKSFSNYFSNRFFSERKCILNPLVAFSVDQINTMLPKLRIGYASDRPDSELVLNAVPSYLLIEGDMICPGIMQALDYVTVLGVPLFKQYMVVFDQAKGRVGFGKTNKCFSYHWGSSEWSECSNATCSLQTRKVNCFSPESKSVNETKCVDLLKPPTTRICTEDESSSYNPPLNSYEDSFDQKIPEWETRKPIRKGGPKSFTFETRKPTHKPVFDKDGNEIEEGSSGSSSSSNINDINSTNIEQNDTTTSQDASNSQTTQSRKSIKKPIPKIKQSSLKNLNACVIPDPEWKIIGGWSDCDQICGAGVQRRKVYCLDGFGAVTNDTECSGRKPQSQKLCAVGKCQSEFHWGVSEWNGCSQQCGEGNQERQATCVDASVWRFVDDHRCKGPPPILRRNCLGQPLCTKFKWDWEPCEVNCPELALIYCYNITSNRIVTQDNCRSIPNLLIPIKCPCYFTQGEGRFIKLANESSLSNESSSSFSPKSSTPIFNSKIKFIIFILILFISLLFI